MEDKVTKFGTCAQNIAKNVENILKNTEFVDEGSLNFLAGYSGCNLASLENLVAEKEVDTEEVATMLANLAEAGMAGVALLNGLKGNVSSLADQMTDLYARKNRDYGNSFDRSMDKFGLVVSAIRIGDKVNRLQSLIEKGGAEVKDESIADTFIDLACYSIMTLMWCAEQIEK